MEDSSGKMITENFYWLSTVKDIQGSRQDLKSPLGFDWELFVAKPKSVADFKDLEKLPKVEIEKSFTNQQDSTEMKGVVRVKNLGKSLAFMVHLSFKKEENNDEISPVYWGDNYFSLFPGEEKEVSVRFNKIDKGTGAAQLNVDGWNVIQK